MMGSRSFVGIGALVILLASASGVLAQANHLQFYSINVKSGSEAEWASFISRIKDAADKNGAPQAWNVWQGVLGTSSTNYYVTLGFDSWGEIDLWEQVPAMLTQAFGEAEAQKILKVGGESTWDVATKLYSLDRDRSAHLDKMGEGQLPAFLQLLLGKVKPEKVGEYQGLQARFKVAQEKHGSQISIRRSTRFGPSWEFYSATLFDKWAEWDNDEGFWPVIAKEYGEAEARDMQSRLRSCYEEREIIVVQHVPELSRSAPSSTSND